MRKVIWLLELLKVYIEIRSHFFQNIVKFGGNWIELLDVSRIVKFGLLVCEHLIRLDQNARSMWITMVLPRVIFLMLSLFEEKILLYVFARNYQSLAVIQSHILWSTDVKVGDELLVDGGMVRFEVIEKIGPDVKCRCTDPGLMLPRANLTFWRDGSLVRERNAMLPTISSKVVASIFPLLFKLISFD